MVQITTISENLSLHNLKTDFGLNQTTDPQFFREWVDGLPELTDLEKQLLDRVKSNYQGLTERSQLSENLVKMAVVSPLLDLAGFYSANFQVRDEATIEVSGQDEGIVYRGKIDVLVFQEQFWAVVIESKNSGFSLNKAMPQALAYMLASPNSDRPTFGLITNGSDFRFLKLTQAPPLYALSKIFSILDPGNDLYSVLRIFKQIGRLVK